MDLQLQGKTAFVSGSHRGTGEIIAQTLSAEGARVIFHSMEDSEPSDICKDSSGIWVCGDLSGDEGAHQTIEQTHAAVGHVDILVNNYGTAGRGKWLESSSDDWLDMYQANVLSATRLIQAFSPAMINQSWGRIVQLGTIGSHQPAARMPHYYTSKGALATMGASLAQEMGSKGITVNTVSPGFIHTPEIEAHYRRRAEKLGWGDEWPEIEAKIATTDFPNPCGRIATRQEVADAVAFLCSARAGFISGQNLRVDGGAVNYV